MKYELARVKQQAFTCILRIAGVHSLLERGAVHKCTCSLEAFLETLEELNLLYLNSEVDFKTPHNWKMRLEKFVTLYHKQQI